MTALLILLAVATLACFVPARSICLVSTVRPQQGRPAVSSSRRFYFDCVRADEEIGRHIVTGAVCEHPALLPTSLVGQRDTDAGDYALRRVANEPGDLAGIGLRRTNYEEKDPATKAIRAAWLTPVPAAPPGVL